MTPFQSAIAIQDRVDYEARTANATVALATITLILAIGTVVLAIYTYKLWRATKAMVEKADHAAKQQSRDMRSSIDAMSHVAAGIHESAEASKRAVDAMQDQASTARRILVANHPPDLEVRDFLIEDGEDLIIHFTVASIGVTSAKIVEFGITLEWSGVDRALPIQPSFSGLDNLRGRILDPASEASASFVVLSDLTAFYAITNDHSMLKDARLFIMSFAMVEDENAVRRRMNFTSEYSKTERRFPASLRFQ